MAAWSSLLLLQSEIENIFLYKLIQNLYPGNKLLKILGSFFIFQKAA
jgi:hypothetical protein